MKKPSRRAIGAITDVVLYLCTYLFIQFAVTLILAFCEIEPLSTFVILAQLIPAAIVIPLFLRLRWTSVGLSWLHRGEWRWLLWLLLFTVALIVPTIWVDELLGVEMASGTEKLFTALLDSPVLGYVVVCLIAPTVEELVFRGAIARRLFLWLSPWVGPRRGEWIAIIVSALSFTVLHDLSQMPHAFFMGVVFAWVFFRSMSIVPAIIMHWVNNSIAFILGAVTDDAQTIEELFRGDLVTANVVLVVSTVVAAVAGWKAYSMRKA